MQKYSIREGVPKKIKENLKNFSDLERKLLFARGIKDDGEADRFLNPNYDLHTHDPYLLKDMDKTVERMREAIDRNEKIAIYSDYDADGIPGAVVLTDFFKRIKYNNFINYIPTRNGEGFGLNVDAIDYLHKEKVNLIITIDCGITDVSEVDLANQYNIDVIITDHHLPGEKIPKAFAIINPKQKECKYPEKMLCGSGVIFKVVQALSQVKQFNLAKGLEKWSLDMVGLATLSDMVPLFGENRIFAHYGLLVLRKSARPGLRRLFANLKIDQRLVTEDDIAFMITPRINAASRMGIPMDAFKLLSTDDEVEAGILVEHLNSINNERKGVVGSMVREIKKKIEDRNGEIRNVIVMGNPEWKPSLVGLVANSFSDEHGRPVFIWGRSDDGIIKGSCRSGGSISVVNLMDKVKDILIDAGGHNGAGGFSLFQENIHHLEDRLNQAFLELESSLEKDTTVYVDDKIGVNSVNMSLWKSLEKFSPFGFENPKPVFVFENVIVANLKMFGKEKNHLEIKIKEKENSKELTAISFFSSPDNFVKKIETGNKINLVATIELSNFRNFPELRLRIVDIY